MNDCHVCSLPSEVQAEVDAPDGPWLTLICVNHHLVVLRADELRNRRG